MTLKEIAWEAGVSTSTVPRAISKDSTNAVSRKVQDRVWEVARHTRRTPNATVRSLKTGVVKTADPPTRSIACLYARTEGSNSGLFFSTLARSTEKKAFKHNYMLKYSFTGIGTHHPNTFRLIIDNHVDGMVVLGRCDKQTLSFLKKYFNCVAYIELNLLEARYDQVICGGCQASLTAVDTPLGLGHTRIGLIGEAQSEGRYTGYYAALSAHGSKPAKSYIVNVPLFSE